MRLAVLTYVVEKLRASDGLDVRHQNCQLRVNHNAAMAYVMFADEGEDEASAPLNLQMVIPERRQAVGAITPDALLRADAKIEVVDEAHDDGQHALAREIIARDVFVGAASEKGQMLA